MTMEIKKKKERLLEKGYQLLGFVTKRNIDVDIMSMLSQSTPWWTKNCSWMQDNWSKSMVCRANEKDLIYASWIKKEIG